MRAGLIGNDKGKATRAAWRHNQMVELADWDALDLDVLASDRAMWSESAGCGDEGGEAAGAAEGGRR